MGDSVQRDSEPLSGDIRQIAADRRGFHFQRFRDLIWHRDRDCPYGQYLDRSSRDLFRSGEDLFL